MFSASAGRTDGVIDASERLLRRFHLAGAGCTRQTATVAIANLDNEIHIFIGLALPWCGSPLCYAL
jgi:hypothetical protein